MIVIERSPDQGVRIGRYILRVLAVRADEVVVALLDPERDCGGCGEESSRRCPGCGEVVCDNCARSWHCPRCAHWLG